jgi:peptidoglycan glycosyltransferase
MMLNREINRLLRGVLVGFGLIVLTSAYWTVIGPSTLYLRGDNPRLVEAERAIRRGEIVDQNDNPLAITQFNGQTKRVYPHPDSSSVVGYSSLRYGVGGAEAAYNSLLRGDTLTTDVTTALVNGLLHRPQEGSDIKLTVDLRVQKALAAALAGQRGAAVVLSVPDGGIMGLVSQPGYDPNTLDADWETLIAAPEKPFFNRVLQGSYQPGGLLETPLMAAAMVANQSPNTIITNVTRPVTTGDLELDCALRLPPLDLSLREAYAFACPYPFTELATTLGADKISETFHLFHLGEPFALPGFTPNQPENNSQPLNRIIIDDENLRDAALGQGDLTVTPLQMAVMAAAVINDGDAPRPYVLLATRPPEEAGWTADTTTRPTMAYMTQQTARQLQDLMRNAVANGAALNAARPGIDIGGHATLTFSGDETQAWFIGFATLEGGRSIATAVVLENSTDPGLAADIGGSVLATAHQALRRER